MTISSDVFKISEYIEDTKNKFIEVPEETLSMGIFGYLSEISSNILQNAVVMISEYSNEAIPVKAKFEKNIITHALSLGIKKIQATPASMEVMIMIPEDNLLANMDNDVFILDKSIKIFIENFEYHVDHDVVIHRVQLLNRDFVYTGMYDIDPNNVLSNITNPYLPPLGRIRITNINLIALKCTIRQMEYIKISKKILTDNPLENKVINFTFDSQLAYFDVDIKEPNSNVHLTPIYEGLLNTTANKYCNYAYLDTNTIRLKFNRDSYEPRVNCDVIINIYTTKGYSGNFKYTKDIMIDLQSERFTYDKLFMIVKPITDSEYGTDKKTIDEIKAIIPKEALARDSIISYTDLNNFFNSINNIDCRLHFLEKVHNQIDRSYYSYILLKQDNNVVPTNTVDLTIKKQNFNNTKNGNYIFNPGNTVYYKKNNDAIIKIGATDADVITLEKTGFVYINPFMLVVNKSPFFLSYYLNIMNITKFLNFDYINQNCKIQFIATSFNWKREYFTDRNTYKLNISFLQNINANMDLVEKDSNGNIIRCDIKVIAVLYNDVKNPYRYYTGNIVSYDEGSCISDFEIQMTTDDTMDKEGRILINGGYVIQTSTVQSGFFSANTKMDIFILVKNDEDTSLNELSNLVPGLTEYSLSNRYGVIDGIDWFHNYSNIISSYIRVDKKPNSLLDYHIRKLPVIKRSYIDTEEKMINFINELEKRRHYLEYCLLVLEDSFGIDFKFFNTYGPSELFNIDTNQNIDKTNISMTFKVKFVSVTDKYIKNNIIVDIKDYMEDINNISDLHIPNLITMITNKYRQQLVYFEFVDINGYGPAYQHVTQSQETNINIVPEFLNINTNKDGSPDINLIIMP